VGNRTRTPGFSEEKGHTGDTRNDDGSRLQRLASGDSMNGTPGTGARAASGQGIIRSARTLREAGIETDIHWVPGYTGIAGNEEAERQVNLAR